MSMLSKPPPVMGDRVLPALRSRTSIQEDCSLSRTEAQKRAARLMALAVLRAGRYANWGVAASFSKISAWMRDLTTRAMHLPNGSCSAIGLRLGALVGGLPGLGSGFSQQSVQMPGMRRSPGERQELISASKVQAVRILAGTHARFAVWTKRLRAPPEKESVHVAVRRPVGGWQRLD